MILSIKDRLVFPGIFAANKDTMTEASVQRSIRSLTSITEQETKDISLRASPNGFIWDAAKGIDKEFPLDAIQTAYLKETIHTLSRSCGVTQDLLPVCEKIHAL